jgi:Pvc16 N-terminal domain
MSNFLAIATVTATLSRTLTAAVGTDVSAVNVTTLRPDDAPERGVNVYLYQVGPNGAWRNADLPTRRDDGRLVQRPRVALDLHYLLSFYGDEAQFEPQRMLGSVVRTLHARPVLTRQMIRDTVSDPDNAFLANSNLADEVELIKFTPSSLSLEELSKLWSVFFQVPYALSVAYQASVVLIEPEVTPQEALPVRERNVYVVPFRQPTIEQIMSQAGDNQPVLPDQPILAGHRLILVGKQLRSEVTRVRIGGVEAEPQAVSDTQLGFPLPGNLRAGLQGVQVVHYIQAGTPPTPHRGFESNVAAFVLRPTVTATASNVQGSGDDPRSADIEVDFNPQVGRSQRVVLLLNEFQPPSDRPARAYTFSAPPRNEPTDPDETNSITVPISGVEPGTYLVRVQVDGAESPLGFDEATGQYDSPQVTLP